MPRQRRIMRPRIHRPHDEKDISKDRRRVYPKWNRRNVTSPRPVRKPSRLPRVKEIPANTESATPGSTRPVTNSVETRKRSQPDNQQQIGKPGKEQPKESIHIARSKPGQPPADPLSHKLLARQRISPQTVSIN